MQPSELYKQDIRRGHTSANAKQLDILKHFDKLSLALNNKNQIVNCCRLFISRFLSFSITPDRGMYLYGDVGRGKTYLMDLFYQSLHIKKKSRLHFHRFMQLIHNEIENYRQKRIVNPAKKIAQKLAQENIVICLDELFVQDVVDAMILGKLLVELSRLGVTLVITSNIKVEELYLNGVHRDRFMPAINAIKKFNIVYALAGDIDYRLQTLVQENLYFFPINANNQTNLHNLFENLAPEAPVYDKVIPISGRELKTVALAVDFIWLTFYDICVLPRSPIDYIQLACEYHGVFISDILVSQRASDDTMRRFIALVDEFYDRRVKLIVSADAAIDDLYTGSRLAFEFKRTKSRLHHMQREDYLKAGHIPNA